MPILNQRWWRSSVVLFGVCLGCSDTAINPYQPPRDGEALGNLQGAVQSARVDEIARAMAMALKDGASRMQLLEDLRDSPFPQQRIHLTEYLQGDRGHRIVSDMAQNMNLLPQGLGQLLRRTPSLELIIPRSYDRASWTGDESIIIAGLEDVFASRYRQLKGFDVLGEEHVIEMWRWAPQRPVLFVYPVVHEFGPYPEQRRLSAPVQTRNTVSRPDADFHPDVFGIAPVTTESLGNSGQGGVTLSSDCDPSAPVFDPCHGDPGGGGTNWGGYWLPPWVNWNACIFAPSDLDGDGFDDACEYELAKQFAPRLATNSLDITTREPAWAAGPIPASGRVVIFFAISYHEDLGCAVCGAGNGSTWHYGDAEWIVVVVEPVSPTSHRWRVVNASLSAHWGEGWPWDQSRTVQASDLFWADVYRGRPLIWASKWKHANYKSQASCNDKLNDTCSGNAPEPFPLHVAQSRHLGLSWGSQRMNCVASTQGLPGQECYWSANRFQGWHGAGPDAGGYKYSLAFFGF